MSTHTPGPWRVTDERGDIVGCPHSGVFIRARDGKADFFIAEMIGGTGSEEADARLIAAAPDLLKACQHVSHFAHTDPPEWMAQLVWAKTLELVESAIAKAEGE